jgi:hypothetical protein
MNKNKSVIMASAVAAILALGVVAVTIPHQAFAEYSNPCCDQQQQPEKKIDVTKIAIGGNGGSGGAGGAGGEGGNGGHNDNKDSKNKVDQDANGGDSNGGHGGNADGGHADIIDAKIK